MLLNYIILCHIGLERGGRGIVAGRGQLAQGFHGGPAYVGVAVLGKTLFINKPVVDRNMFAGKILI